MKHPRYPVLSIIAVISALLSSPVLSQNEEMPDELVLSGVDIIDVAINGKPVRLEVDPNMTGPLTLNPETVKRLDIWGRRDLVWNFGAISVPAVTTRASIDFGFGKAGTRVAWSALRASTKADGVIGVYDLPYRRVSFMLSEPAASEQTQTFKLKLKNARNYKRLGTEIEVGEKKLFAIFAINIEPNFVSARTANFLATHHDGGFVPDSDGSVEMMLGIRRPTLDMRLARPIELGDLTIDTIAVRIDDHGRANKVGEIGKDDPRFKAGHIVVSRRKGRGRPDLVTRIGRGQIDHCSSLTFDLKAMEGTLSCASDHAGAD